MWQRNDDTKCIVCDNGGYLNANGWCDRCVDEFQRVMATVTCAEESGACTTPLTCLGAKRCVQLRAAIRLLKTPTSV
jgi:hypothetical protein